MIDALEFFIVAKEKPVCIGQTRLLKVHKFPYLNIDRQFFSYFYFHHFDLPGTPLNRPHQQQKS
jgi:hypothetical protein